MKQLPALFFLLLSTIVAAQDSPSIPTRIETVLANADHFIGRDQFGNLYLTSDNVLTRLQGNLSLEYKNLAKGKISHIDIQNPLLLLLFYQSFNTIVLLDDQLNEVSEINLNNPDQPLQAQAAGLASQNRIWIYDALQQQIVLFDYKTNNYRTLTPPLRGNMKYYQSDFNNFHWIDDSNSRFTCDVYGKITALGKVPEFETCQIVSDNHVIYRQNGNLYWYVLSKNKSVPLGIEEKSLRSFSYKDQILSIFTKDGITNYKITLP